MKLKSFGELKSAENKSLGEISLGNKGPEVKSLLEKVSSRSKIHETKTGEKSPPEKKCPFGFG